MSGSVQRESPRSLRPVMIQYSLGDASHAEHAAALRDLGVELDSSYGPVLIDPRSGTWLVRGRFEGSDPGAAEAASPYTFFPDSLIGAVGPAAPGETP